MGVVKFIPLSALAAVLISVAIKIMDIKEFSKLATFGIRDGIILFATMLLTVFTDLTYGVLGGLALSFILNAKNIAKKFSIEKVENVYKVTGSLYFLSANKLFDYMIKELETQNKLTIDLKGVDRVDYSSVEKISKIIVEAKNQGKTVEILADNEIINKRLDKYL